VRKLLEVLHRLADQGNSIIIIEHNLDVIRNADWILDLGPEGGENGGRIVAEGRPANVAATPDSFTGQFLARYYSSEDAKLEPLEVDFSLDVASEADDPGLAEKSDPALLTKSGKPKRAAAKKTAAKKTTAKKVVARKKVQG